MTCGPCAQARAAALNTARAIARADTPAARRAIADLRDALAAKAESARVRRITTGRK